MALLIRFRTLPVRELFTELSRYEFIRNIGATEDFRGKWAAAADELAELQEGERDVLKSVGLALGTSDVDGQLSMLEVSAKRLSDYGDEAHAEYLKKGKLYRTCGLLAGLFAAILIM
jgi:stage III sporulation protein AB